MHIVSASRRTDIPAFHSAWFMNRVRDGMVRVRQPFRGGFYEVSLAPEDVIAIVFWTKNALPMLEHLAELERLGHCCSFLYTINNYPKALEPRVPPLEQTMETVRRLGELVPSPCIRWRYDTIVLTEALDREWHLKNFEMLCGLLAPFTRECIFSFCDYYKKTIRNVEEAVPDFVEPDEDFCRETAEEMAEIAAAHDITLKLCAHDFLLSERVRKARCIDPEFLARMVDREERSAALKSLKQTPTRKGCACTESRDIGAYDTCGHGCVYCYANSKPALAAKRMALIDPAAPSLDPAINDS